MHQSDTWGAADLNRLRPAARSHPAACPGRDFKSRRWVGCLALPCLLGFSSLERVQFPWLGPYCFEPPSSQSSHPTHTPCSRLQQPPGATDRLRPHHPPTKTPTCITSLLHLASHRIVKVNRKQPWRRKRSPRTSPQTTTRVSRAQPADSQSLGYLVSTAAGCSTQVGDDVRVAAACAGDAHSDSEPPCLRGDVDSLPLPTSLCARPSSQRARLDACLIAATYAAVFPPRAHLNCRRPSLAPKPAAHVRVLGRACVARPVTQTTRPSSLPTSSASSAPPSSAPSDCDSADGLLLVAIAPPFDTPIAIGPSLDAPRTNDCRLSATTWPHRTPPSSTMSATVAAAYPRDHPRDPVPDTVPQQFTDDSGAPATLPDVGSGGEESKMKILLGLLKRSVWSSVGRVLSLTGQARRRQGRGQPVSGGLHRSAVTKGRHLTDITAACRSPPRSSSPSPTSSTGSTLTVPTSLLRTWRHDGDH